MITAIQVKKNGLDHDRETMGVKMFILNEPSEAEQAVADWLAANRVEICHVTQSQSERNGRFLFIVSLFYQPARL